MSKFGLFSIAAAAGLMGIVSAAPIQGQPTTTVSAVSPKSTHAGKTAVVSLVFSIPSGFHIYSPAYKGDTGVPVTVKAEGLPTGLTLKALKAPRGEQFEKRVTMALPITVAKSVHGRKSFKIKVRYQQCNDRICLPPANAYQTVTLNIK